MSVLVDSSAWIDYFRGIPEAAVVDFLLEEDLVATNDLILAELIPSLQQRKKRTVITLLKQVKRYAITIDWDDIIHMRITCLRNGINGVGIPDLMIAQNARQNHLSLLTFDKHFTLMSEQMPFTIYGRSEP